MRDVTPNNLASFQNNIKEHLFFIIQFLRHPVEKIKNIPNWPTIELLFVFFLLTISSGVLRGIISLKIYVILYGMMIAPFITAIMLFLFSLMLYYYFQLFENKTHALKPLLTFIFFANIPFLIFQIGSEYVPPLEIVGFAFTAILLVVGLTEIYMLPKKRSIQLVGVLFSAVFLVWVINKIDLNQFGR